MAVNSFYLEAERKTIAIRDGAELYVLKGYGAFLTLPIVYAMIVKMIIEKCASEPITWHVTIKAR